MKKKYLLYIESMDHSGSAFEVYLTDQEVAKLEQYLDGIDLETWWLEEPDGVNEDYVSIHKKIHEFLHGE